MHITEYFVILYSELQEIMKKFKVAYLHHQSMLNLENDADNKEDNKADNNAGKDAAKEADKEDDKEDDKEAANEADKEAEEDINLKEIYRKLLFIFHPDKSISPNEQIFGEIKKAWDDKYMPTILYYFVKNSSHPMLLIIYEKMHNTKGFLKILKNLCNVITKEINDIRRTPIWKNLQHFGLV